MVEINGKQVELKLDFGAVKVLKKEYDIDVFKLTDKDMTDIDIFTNILLVCAKRGGGDITMEDIDTIEFRDVDAIMDQVFNALEEFSPEDHKKGKGKSKGNPPLTKKLQK